MSESPEIVPLMTVSEVAARLRKGRAFVYSEIHQDKLPAKKFGRSFGIRPSDLAAYIAPTEAPSLPPRSERGRIKQLMRQQ